MMKFFNGGIVKAVCVSTMLWGATAIADAQLKVTPTSRFMMDAGMFSSKGDDQLKGGVAIKDFRMGLKASYEQFFFKADASFVHNSITMKDVYLQYNMKKCNFLRMGYFLMPFGLSSAYGNAFKQFMFEPTSNVFDVPRRVGVMHSTWNKHLWLSYGVFADNSALTKSTEGLDTQGYTLIGRFVHRPINTEGKLLQWGISGGFIRSDAGAKNSPNGRETKYGVTYNTIIDKTKALNAIINHSKNEVKYTVELAGFYHNLAFESQYYQTHVNRYDNPSFNGRGFYATGKWIIVNPVDYQVADATGAIKVPNNGQLELALGFNMLDLDDNLVSVDENKRPLQGLKLGKMMDYTVGLSYFWNKYVILRANYSYIVVDRPQHKGANKINALQFRAQYYF